MQIVCSSCGERYPLNTRKWVCRRCGGLFEFADTPAFDPSRIADDVTSLWRYRSFIPLPEDAKPLSMGEGYTPLIETELGGARFQSKLDFLMPTGSFKDRGTTVLVSALKCFGFLRVVEDSSGNAAASLAGYSAYAGIDAEIFVPAHASPAKLAQIEVYGARLSRVQGPRENAARAAEDAARLGEAYYASHYYNPFELAGMKTTAWEIWEQLGKRAPSAVFAPVGHGTNLIGLARGFRDLHIAGLIDKPPALFATQAENISPLAKAFQAGLAVKEPEGPGSENDQARIEYAWAQELEKVAHAAAGRTLAEGIAITRPVRGIEILRAVTSTGGAVVSVSEAAIVEARNQMALTGLFIEPTSATAVAALLESSPSRFQGDVVVTLTGSGLKSAGQV